MNFEFSKFSQNGEDGIIEEIFKRIGTSNKYFVEFGIENGQECNCRWLVENNGWQGLWIDGGAENIRQAKEHYQNYPVTLAEHFIDKDNIVEIFNKYQVPQEFDLLSIDIDGNDYWVWESLKSFQPRVVIMEYNGSYFPHEEWVMPYNPKHRFNSTANYGASLRSYEALGRQLGYRLIGCDSAGVNAFFVHEKFADNFSHNAAGAEYHYVCPKFRNLSIGWPRLS